jgi:hypothetical protein
LHPTPSIQNQSIPKRKKSQAKVFSWISFEGCSMLLRADAIPLFSKLVVILQSIFLFKSQASAPTKATKQLSSTDPKIPLLQASAIALGIIIHFLLKMLSITSITLVHPTHQFNTKASPKEKIAKQRCFLKEKFLKKTPAFRYCHRTRYYYSFLL